MPAVEISEELATVMLPRIADLTEQKALNPSLYEINYCDSSPSISVPGEWLQSGRRD